MENLKYMCIRDIAEELKVSKQRVYRCIKANHIKETHIDTVKGNSVLMYDNQAIQQIKDIIHKSTSESHEAHHEAHHEAVNDTVNNALIKQLDVKDKQIASLLKQIEDMKSEHHEELMALQKNLDNAQKLHCIDAQKLMELEQPKEPIESRKKWFERIFK